MWGWGLRPKKPSRGFLLFLSRLGVENHPINRRPPAADRVPARGVRALRSTRLPAGRAGTFRLPRWAA